MLLAIMILTFATVFFIFFILLHSGGKEQNLVKMRLKALNDIGKSRTDIEEELTKPFRQRVLNPLSGSMATTLMRFTPKALRKMVEQKNSMAGTGKLNTDSFLLLWGLSSVLLPLILLLVTISMKTKPNIVIGLSLLAFVVGTALPIFLLNQKIIGRKKRMEKDLPDVLDILTVSVEAGLGFDGALVKLAEKMKGALVDEFSKVLQEIRMGVSRRDSLRELGLRCDVPSLSVFVTSLIQADQLGVSIGNVLRVQSATMRQKYRQRVEEKAMKAPIKMLIPLVFFIFPAIFVILLGPAVIQMIDTFSK